MVKLADAWIESAYALFATITAWIVLACAWMGLADGSRLFIGGILDFEDLPHEQLALAIGRLYSETMPTHAVPRAMTGASWCACWVGVAVGACSVGDLQLDGRGCPCVSGYTCDGSRNVCVLAEPAGGDGAVPPDGDASADTTAGGDAAGDRPTPPNDAASGDAPPPVCNSPTQACGNLCVEVSSNPQNCGRCGHDCLGGTCSAGSCQPVLLATDSLTPASLTSDGINVYWTSGSLPGGIYSCPVGGCAASGPVLISGAALSPTEIATDGVHVYWVDPQSGEVDECPIAGCPSSPLTLAGGQSQPSGIAVDGASVYWTALQSPSLVVGEVMQCAIGGCAGNPAVFAGNLASPTGIAVDATSVYFESGDELWSCPRTGCGGGPVALASGTSSINVGALSIGGVNAYWSAGPGGALFACGTGGCGSAMKAAVEADGVAVDGAFVYWTQSSQSAVFRCPLAGCGGAPVTLAANRNPMGHIAVDPTAIYWLEPPKIYKLAK